MLVIIVGGGQVGSALATKLRNENHEVRVIERRKHVLDKLYNEFPKDVVVEGNGTDPEDLQVANISKADVVCALTGADEVNLVVANIAKFEYGVGKVVARVNSPRNAWLFDAGMGVDCVLNQAEVLANIVTNSLK